MDTWRLVTFAVLLLPSPSVRAELTPKVDFNREVRPILAENCFACHGPDEAQRKSKLRLDVRDEAIGKVRGDRVAIVPGDVRRSGVIARIGTSDPEEIMPPPESKKKLSTQQIEILKRWIEQGAPYDEHWAFVAPRRVDPPAVEGDHVRNDIDRFIVARLMREGIRSADEAPKETLIRRVTFDLIGLPPTLEEVDGFVNDSSPDAYERVVDRLLSSGAFGERMAMHWLDLARYADTNGYHIDNHRDMWKWREWVIDAFNRNMPFDEFAVEQLAGDLLPDATLSQRIASGFNRNGMVNFEGGADPAEYLSKYIVDRITTTSTVFLGITMQCAECHDHKYDPFTMRDFYSLYAYFHNVPEKGLDGQQSNPVPSIQVPGVEDAAKAAELKQKIAALDAKLKAPSEEMDAAQSKWEQSLLAELRENPRPIWKPLANPRYASANGAMLSMVEDGSILAAGPNPDTDVYEVEAIVSGVVSAIRLEALPDGSLPFRGAGRADNSNFVLTGFEADVHPSPAPGAANTVRFSAAFADHSQASFPVSSAIDADARSGWAVDGDKKRERREAIFVPAGPLELVPGTKLKVRLRFESSFARHAIGRFRISTTSSTVARAAPISRPEKIDQIVTIEREKRTAVQRRELQQYYRENFSEEHKQLGKELAELRKAEVELNKTIPQVMVMEEMVTPRATHMLVRGDFRKKGERVEPAIPAIFARTAGISSDAPKNRLTLAKWIVSKQNPLTARVSVNQFWQMLFGVGLVKTAEDFGTQGEWPSHPELLDHLAGRFVESGWDVKQLLRLMVTSATYRQSARIAPELLARDPENRLLARGARFRLAAEMIRDNAMAISGLLDRRVGGPSMFPYQPPRLWEEIAFGGQFSSQTYVQSKGANLYRRGLYIYGKRSMPHPSLTTFDAPNREVCTVRRPITNTPLQALLLLNDPIYVEAARVLAQRVMKENQELSAGLRHAFRLCTGRSPSSNELAILVRSHRRALDEYRANPEAAKKLVGVGESPRADGVDSVELAAWMSVMNLLLNLDETVTRG